MKGEEARCPATSNLGKRQCVLPRGHEGQHRIAAPTSFSGREAAKKWPDETVMPDTPEWRILPGDPPLISWSTGARRPASPLEVELHAALQSQRQLTEEAEAERDQANRERDVVAKSLGKLRVDLDLQIDVAAQNRAEAAVARSDLESLQRQVSEYREALEKIATTNYGRFDVPLPTRGQMEQIARSALTPSSTPGRDECEHDWIDIRNEAVESGEMCRKCNAVRAGNSPTPEHGTK